MPSPNDAVVLNGHSYAVAIDIGGTFTDVMLREQHTGKAWRAKTPSHPADPSVAFIAGMTQALALAGADAASVSRVLHGTTVATNLILESKGAETALITTAGLPPRAGYRAAGHSAPREPVCLAEAAPPGAGVPRVRSDGADRRRGRGGRAAR